LATSSQTDAVFDDRIVGLFGIGDIQENNVPDVSRLSL
jgi:hypothetical protein